MDNQKHPLLDPHGLGQEDQDLGTMLSEAMAPGNDITHKQRAFLDLQHPFFCRNDNRTALGTPLHHIVRLIHS